MFKVALGHSEDPDTEDAVQDVIQQCRLKLGDVLPKAAIVFVAVDYDYPTLLKRIHEAFPGIQLIGCSSGGELSSIMGYTQGSLLLATFAADRIAMATAVLRHASRDLTASVKEAVDGVKRQLQDDIKLCLILPDHFTIGTVRIVDELQKTLGANIPILGGGASDPNKLTNEFYDEEILTDAVPMLFFAGPLDYTFSVASGWEPFTCKKLVTTADKNIGYKIGDESALNFYKRYLNATPTIAHPLAVFEEGQERFYLRAPLEINEKDDSVIFGGDLPQNAMTSICQAEPEKLIKEVKKLADEILPTLKDQEPACALVVSCACRQNILGTKTKEEYRVLSEELPPNLPIFGFYAYGQVSPFEKNAPTFVHNDSIVALLLNEQYEIGK